jgi:hypothetical protein
MEGRARTVASDEWRVARKNRDEDRVASGALEWEEATRPFEAQGERKDRARSELQSAHSHLRVSEARR